MKNMIRSLVGVSVGCAVLSGISARAADGPGPYFKAEIGPNIPEDVTLRDFLGLGGGKIEFDPGMRLAIGGGYAFNDFIAIGGETGASFNYIDNISGGFRGEGDSSIGQVPLLGNIIFKFPNPTGLVPFIGAGAGVSFAYFNADDLVFEDTIVDGSEVDAVFAWQAFAGLKYALNDRMSLGLTYKYLHAESPDWEAEDVFTGLDSEISIGDLKTHAVMFVFSFKF